MDDVKQTVKQFILDEFLPGEDPASLTDSTDLVRQGIIDSLATLKLVSFLEERFNIQIEAYEVSPGSLNTLSDITSLVERKMNK